MNTKQLIKDIEKSVTGRIELTKENRAKYNYELDDMFEITADENHVFNLIPPTPEKEIGHGWGWAIPSTWIELRA